MQMATFDIPHVFMALSCIVFDIINPKANVCHRPGLPGGVAGNSPPNFTPLFKEIGTITGSHVSQKRLVRFGNNLHYVIAGA